MTRDFFGIQHFYSTTSKLVLRCGGLYKELNVQGISTGERIMVWAKLTSGRGVEFRRCRTKVETRCKRATSLFSTEPWPLTNIKPLHPPIPTILLSPILYPLCEFNISPQVKSQIGKQLHGPNKPRLDLSTDLFVMPCNQLREKVTSRSRACSET